MNQIVAVDIGGTHARFALANIKGQRVIDLTDVHTLKTAEFASLQTAWEAFGARVGRTLPRAAGIAIACAVKGDVLKLTNNPWIVRPALIGEKLNVDHHVIVNDFEAVGHAVAQAGADRFTHLCGPDVPLPDDATISIVGPGTGLGVAHIWRSGGAYRVNATEGGHIDFAPTDIIEDAILQRLRRQHRRVSAERVVSGPAIVDIYHTLAEIEGRAVSELSDVDIWQAGMAGTDSLAAAAIDRLCLSLGSVTGDIALAQGAKGVVVGGGLGARLAKTIQQSGFSERFCAKGRFEAYMAAIPVKLIALDEPGLFGAAAAFAMEHGTPRA
jgi:glucokinase